MRFGLRCFTCGQGFDPTDTHAEIWCDGENVVTLCPGCTVASDLRIDLHKHGGPGGTSELIGTPEQQRPSFSSPDTGSETFIWDALKRMQERADDFRLRRRKGD